MAVTGCLSPTGRKIVFLQPNWAGSTSKKEVTSLKHTETIAREVSCVLRMFSSCLNSHLMVCAKQLLQSEEHHVHSFISEQRKAASNFSEDFKPFIKTFQDENK